MGHLALRVLTTAGAARILAQAAEDPSAAAAGEGSSSPLRNDHELFKDVKSPLNSSDYSSVWRLEHHAEKTSAKDAVIYEKVRTPDVPPSAVLQIFPERCFMNDMDS